MQALQFVFAFVVVLALIGLAAWLVRRFAGNRLGANANRGRMPRLAVIDAAAVDGRRRLVLVRRDNIEHLLMIGGPTDIVVEQNIVRAIPSRDQVSPRANAGGDPVARIPSMPDTGGWSDGDGSRNEGYDAEPQMPEPAPRPARPSFADEVRRPAPAMARNSDMPSFVPEPLSRPEPRTDMRSEPAPRGRSEPMMTRPAPRSSEPAAKPPSMRAPERPQAPPPAAQASADQNLAEMAQRLEAALRRPAAEEPRVGAPPVAPEPPSNRPGPRAPSEVSIVGGSKSETSAAPPVASPSPKTGFENLEDEMASLLGRPKNLS